MHCVDEANNLASKRFCCLSLIVLKKKMTPAPDVIEEVGKLCAYVRGSGNIHMVKVTVNERVQMGENFNHAVDAIFTTL